MSAGAQFPHRHPHRHPHGDVRSTPHAGRADRGAVSASVLIWLVAFLALAGLFAGLGWAGVFDGDDGEGGGTVGTIEPTDWTGLVVDSLTGDPLGGVTVTPTDVTGAPISALAVVTSADGTYLIPGLTSEEYGLKVAGALIDHEDGWVASTSGPHGRLVVQTWGEAATYAPGVFGDIALDPLDVPATSVADTVGPDTTVPVAPTTEGAGGGAEPANQGPEIGVLSANPPLVAPSQFCGTTTVTFNIQVTDPDGVESVVVQWSYPTGAAGAAPGTASGTATLSWVPGTNRWTGGTSFWQQPLNDPTWIALKVVATDNLTMYRSRSFDQTLAIQRC